MRIKLALALAAVAVLGACAQSPTASTAVTTAPRYDGGNYYGSGGATGEGGNYYGSGNAVNSSVATSDSATAEGGNTMGSGN